MLRTSAVLGGIAPRWTRKCTAEATLVSDKIPITYLHKVSAFEQSSQRHQSYHRTVV